ncbi:MAG TPA: hypothetical protein VFE74_05405 [Ramlibacter sp.]|nr:hypothetical protein [Ramlibacter sp.]
MKLKLSRSLATAALMACAALATSAQARDNVYWSIGVNAAPGVAVGVGNHRPYVVAPAPVYVAPPPVYVAPQPVYLAPRPVYYAPAPVYYGPSYGHRVHRGHKHHRHHHRGHH